MWILRCVAAIAVVWPFVTAGANAVSVPAVRHRRQLLRNTYAGLGPDVEILPVGDTSGVSSSYSVVETSRVPRREHGAYRLMVRNGPAEDSEPERSDQQTRHPSLSSYGPRETGPKPFKFPQDERRPAAKQSPGRAALRGRGAEDDEDLDAVLVPERRRPDVKPSDRRKYVPPAKKPRTRDDAGDEETFGESKPLPKNIKEIVEERPAESKISDDLKKEGSRYVGSGGFGGGGGGGAEFEKDKHYEKEKGEKFLEGHKSEEGEKAEKAFKKEEAYDKGEKEDYGSDEKKSHVEEKAGEKKGHVDQAQHFGEAFQGNHGEKGVSVVKKGGHKKGKKTSGFHKVHHKDEYKKDEVFYDESHDGDEHEEHKHEHEKHAKEKGANEKKGHTDTGYHESHGSKKADSDHGKKYEQAKGHNSEAGEHAHHGQHSEFAKKGGVKEGEKYGHADAGGGGYFEESGGGGYF